MFLHSWRGYFKITLCTLLPLIGTNIKKKRKGVTSSDAFASAECNHPAQAEDSE